ncbi:hypothetical protein [Streptomyces sp. NPDC051662]|uniref:hypothetical protein n=1 Tax=Streptomyces sp. NPDC051662 TaxID=3154750 RepID=UPI0034238248
MDEALTALEREMEQLRRDARTAHTDQDHPAVRAACEQLRLAESAWYARIGQPPRQSATAQLPPLRSKEQMRLTLAMIGAPAAPKDIRKVTLAFTGMDLPWSRLASVRRDEKRRYATSAGAASYICPALNADTFTPVRGLYALSDWPLERRLYTRTSARVDFLTMVTRLATHEQSATPPVRELLRRMADEITGATVNESTLTAAAVTRAAETELRTIVQDDRARRTAAARVARRDLDPVEQIFGAPRN